MEKITKILVPLDFSECSENALEYAMKLADGIRAELLILHVPSVNTSSLENPASASVAVEEQINLSRKRLVKSVEKATESIGTDLDNAPSIQTDIEMGKVDATICGVAAKNEVDYIVLGTQGENSTLDKYLGSVASNVIKSAPCPVMVIPEDAQFKKNVIMGYATEFLDADPFEIWKLMNIFQPFEPTIKCVHFSEKEVDKEDKIKELESYFSETAPELDVELHSLPAKDKVNDMNDFIEDHDINLLVMYKPKRSFFDSIFHKSYTQEMAKHTTIPLLVFKESKS